MTSKPYQVHRFTRSQTVGAVTSTGASGLSLTPQKPRWTGCQAPAIPHKSSKRNMRNSTDSHSITRDFSKPSPQRSADGLVRPSPNSQSASSQIVWPGTLRATQLSSGSLTGIVGRFKGDSPIRKRDGDLEKVGHSVTSVLSPSYHLPDSAADSKDSVGPFRASRSKTKNVLAKFTGVLTDHFGTKGSRRREKSNDAPSSGNEMSMKPVLHARSLNKLSLSQLNPPTQDGSGTRTDSPHEADNMEKQKTKSITGRAKLESSTTRKRLTIVDEVDFQNSQAIEDPFSESSSGQQSTGFEARLRSRQGSRSGVNPTDPFQVERIMETSVDAILTTPPVGVSTPRRRSRSLHRCESPTKGSSDRPDDISDLIALSPRPSPVKPLRRRKAQTIRHGSLKESSKANVGHNKSGHADRTSLGLQAAALSDSTRLSSYPPGSTIRHVPRSMGRLKDAPSLSASTIDRGGLPMGRKKHPSPNKGQLEMFGKYMEKSLAMGVFKDSDELAMSFNSPQASSSTLAPRDTNRLMRGAAFSDNDLRKDYAVHGNRLGLPKSRSRIPQPVRQLSRSRTDTAFARDFYPPNKGDSTMGDELQWDLSAYRIGHRCNHCGSMNQIV